MMRILLAMACLALPACAERNKEKEEMTGSIEDIRWGEHWAGPELKAPAELKGKVTLLVIWGG